MVGETLGLHRFFHIWNYLRQPFQLKLRCNHVNAFQLRHIHASIKIKCCALATGELHFERNTHPPQTAVKSERLFQLSLSLSLFLFFSRSTGSDQSLCHDSLCDHLFFPTHANILGQRGTFHCWDHVPLHKSSYLLKLDIQFPYTITTKLAILHGLWLQLWTVPSQSNSLRSP